MRLSVCIVELCQDPGHSGAGHGGTRFKPVAVGRNTGENIAAESCDVGLDAAIVGWPAAAGTGD